MGRILAIALLVLMTAALTPTGALAHAHLRSASPAAGSTVNPAPKEVMLSFTEKLEPKFSSIEVRDAKGAALQDGAASGDPADATKLRVALKPLPPGTYKVIWRVLSVDTHRSNGSFTFRVDP